MKKLLIALSVLSAALVYADVPLMKNGSPACSIVPAPGDNPTAQHAAEELALYLGRIGGGKAPAIVKKAEAGKSSVVFQLVKNPKIHKHGFQLETKGKTLYIRAQRPLGLLYGAYEVLKKYGGIRWIHPGPEGEFFKVRSGITVPEVNKISNPSFEMRTAHFLIASWTGPFEPAWDWMVRNNMHIEWDYGSTLEKARPKMFKYALKLAATWRFGWHSFTRLHMGYFTATDKKKCIADYRKMFQEHPERFAMIGGQRRDFDPKTNLAFQNQPCTTNPDNIKIIAHNLVATIRLIQKFKPGWEGRFILSNNDTTNWCQCPDCLAAADPRETRKGVISTRYWKFANAVAAEGRKEMPDLSITGGAYQNFHPVPVGVKPDPQCSSFLGFSNKCYRHKLDDPNCPVNKHFYQLYKDWAKAVRHTITWEECSDNGFFYQGLEFIYADHLKTYHKLGIGGTCPSVPSMLSEYGPHLGKWKYRYENTWRAMWQTIYLFALLQWDIGTDVEKAWEEANALYYGAAWENGMRDYRKLLIRISETTPGCFGYQLNASKTVGRCLSTVPGAEEKLLAYLAKAEKAAKDDPRVLNALKVDRWFLENLWIERNKEYVKNTRKSKSSACCPITGTITIDGKLSEADWTKTDVISNYKDGDKVPKQQTAIRFLYEPEYLYVAIEALEPEIGKMVSRCTKHDGEVYKDNSVELLLNHPGLSSQYYHFIINDKGVLWDTFVNGAAKDIGFDSKAQIAVGKEKDRWIVEMKIPTSALGMKIVPGQTWRFNSQRYRVVKDSKPEGSYLVRGGIVHDPGEFLPISFNTTRSNHRDNRQWRNPDFSQWTKFRRNPKMTLEAKDDMMPAAWILNMFSGKISMETKENNPKDKYLKLTDCRIYQSHNGTQKKYKIFLDAKGTGELRVSVNRYKRKIDNYGRIVSAGNAGAANVFTVKPAADKWQTFSGEYTKPDAQEILGIVLWAKGEVCIDNMYVMPVEEGETK